MKKGQILLVLAVLVILGGWVFYLLKTGSVPTPTPTIVLQPETLPDASFTAFVVNPLDGSTLYADRNIALSWSAMSGASAYIVELSGGPYSTMTPCNWQEGTTCQIGQMWKGHTYSWRIKAKNSSGIETGWSPTWSFTVSSSGPPADAPGCLGAPTIYSPGDGQTFNQSYKVRFEWVPPSNCSPNGYTSRISTSNDPEAQSWIVDIGVGDTTYVHIFVVSGTYYLHVRACQPCSPYNPGAWANRRFVVR